MAFPRRNSIAPPDRAPRARFRAVKQVPAFKPAGLWYAMGSAWYDWTRVELPDRVKDDFHVYAVHLGYGALRKIAVIRTGAELESFHNKYSLKLNTPGEFTLIRWDKVAADHAGIEIRDVPKLARRYPAHEYLWLRMFDVDSGCVWTKDVVDKITDCGSVACVRTTNKDVVLSSHQR